MVVTSVGGGGGGGEGGKGREKGGREKGGGEGREHRFFCAQAGFTVTDLYRVLNYFPVQCQTDLLVECTQ